MGKDNLGDRMKKYEKVNRFYLTRRMPVIIRIDGRAFHTFTKGFQKPFDTVLTKTMMATTKQLCQNIQGCVFGYTQSDEISLLLIDYQTLDSSAWFDYNLQKLSSVAASMATLFFNKNFSKYAEGFAQSEKHNMHHEEINWNYFEILKKAIDSGATFDARAFNLPKEEVTNYFLWRQNDATRNSIEAMGHSHFSQKALHHKSCNEIQKMLFQEKNINWNETPTYWKRGSCVLRVNGNNPDVLRMEWEIDENIPIFKGNGRAYIETLVFPKEEEEQNQ